MKKEKEENQGKDQGTTRDINIQEAECTDQTTQVSPPSVCKAFRQNFWRSNYAESSGTTQYGPC